MGNTILLMDTDETLCSRIQAAFAQEGFHVVVCNSIEQVMTAVPEYMPVLIMSEMELDGIHGTDLCKQLKQNAGTSNIPFVFLSRLSTEIDRVVGFTVGATEYVSKPFSMRELLLRTKAILRRTENTHIPSALSCGPVRVDTTTRKVRVNGRSVRLTRQEFRILLTLMRTKGRVFSRDELLNEAWGSDSFVLPRTVDVHVRTLRKKLGEARDQIETVQGVGYRIRAMDRHQDSVQESKVSNENAL